jgi:hypothetical protein
MLIKQMIFNGKWEFFLGTSENFFVPKPVFEYALRIFWAKLQFFVVLPKFDQNIIFKKFKKKLVRKGLNRQKMARDIYFRAVNPCGLQAKKTGFSHVHCEVPKQPNLDFSFRGL